MSLVSTILTTDRLQVVPDKPTNINYAKASDKQ